MAIIASDLGLSDKLRLHHYWPVYQKLFETLRNQPIKLFEIGIAEGRSIELWQQYFPRATICGVDLAEWHSDWDRFRGEKRIQLYASTNAYGLDFVHELQRTYGTFDIIIDDGSHDEMDMVFVLKHYLPLLSPQGFLIIEDIIFQSWAFTLYSALPRKFRSKTIFCSGKFQDMLFIVNGRDKLRRFVHSRTSQLWNFWFFAIYHRFKILSQSRFIARKTSRALPGKSGSENERKLATRAVYLGDGKVRVWVQEGNIKTVLFEGTMEGFHENTTK